MALGDFDAGCWRLRPRYQPFAIEGEGLFLLGETDYHVLEGQVFVDLLSHLSLGITEHDAADALEGKHPRAVTHYAFHALQERGLLALATGVAVAGDDAFWDELQLDPLAARKQLAATSVAVTGVGAVDADATVRALDSLGFQTQLAESPADESFHVVLADDYLEPEVARLAALNSGARRPWLLCRATGLEVWVGPVFQPGSACYECLSWRLRTNGALQAYLGRKLANHQVIPRPLARTPIHDRLVADLVALTAAEWAAGHADGSPRVWALNLRTWQSTTHTLHQRPQCPACGDPRRQTEISRRPIRLDAEEHLARVELEDLERFVSRLTGIVTSLERAETGIPSLHSYTAFFGFGRDARDLQAFRNGLLSQAAGVGTDERSAKIGAICEALERYSGMAHGDEPTLPASYSQLDPAVAVHPADCMLYSTHQYDSRDAINAKGAPFDLVPHPFDEDAILDWTGVWSLSAQRFKLIPTSYLYYNHPQPPGGPYCWADSNGCAAGRTLTDAVGRGLLELIERDSVAIWWYNRVRRPRVDLQSFESPYFDHFVDAYLALERDVWVLDVTTDLGVPSFVAVSPHKGNGPQDILLSFGAALDPRDAVEHALCEMNHLLPAVLPANRTPDGDYPYPDAAQKHWWTTATVESEPYLVPDDGTPPKRADDYRRVAASSDLDEICVMQEQLESLAFEMLVLDQTRPDVGVPVVKVLVPGLRHFWARFAPGRLYDAPVELGWLPRARAEHELNPISMFL